MKKLLIMLMIAGFASITSGQADASLVAYYDFEGNTLDSSGNGNHATNSGALLGAGYSGQGYTFDGIDDFMSVNLDVNPVAMPQLTWGAWVNSNGATGIRKVLSHDNGGFDRTLGLDTRPGAGTSWSTFTGTGVQGTNAVTPGNWQFIAAIYNENTNLATLYIDGAVSTYPTSFGGGHAFLRIGSNPSFGEYFGGQIDEVFIYDEALSLAQLDAIRGNGMGETGVVPEPASMLLFGGGMVGAFLRRKKLA